MTAEEHWAVDALRQIVELARASMVCSIDTPNGIRSWYRPDLSTERIDHLAEALDSAETLTAPQSIADAAKALSPSPDGTLGGFLKQLRGDEPESPAFEGPGSDPINQARYDAVYEVIRQWPGTATRNAVIWKAVEAAEAARVRAVAEQAQES